MTMALILAVPRRIVEGAQRHRAASGPAGRRPGCSATASPASASASSAWAASARRWRAAPRPSACRSTITTAAVAARSRGARGDLLGEPRPDAGAHGHRLGQLPAHAGDLSPAVGAPAEAAEAARLIVNTARGEVIDENALARMLEAGELAGAGLDVFEHEPAVNPKLLKLPNVVLLPHMGSARSRAASTWARRSSSTSRPSPTATAAGPRHTAGDAATVVFDSDPRRRVVIVWNEAKAALASVSVQNEGTQWRAPEGYTIGTPIAEVERINVMPFKLWGFGWDYGGRVSDWSAGALGQNPICRNSLGFSPRGEANTNAMGDREFNSNDPAIRAADPVVSEFGLMIPAPNAAE
jgi:hypothetical protein